MASATLNPSSTFPVGTTVTVYPRSNFPAWQAPSGAPQGSSTTSGTMAAGGVTFTGLADDTKYVAYAQVSSVDRYVGFATPPAAAGGGGGAPTGSAGGDLSGTYPSPTVPGLATINAALDAARMKTAVRVASTASVTVPPGGTTLTIDGVSLANGDRVLLKDQTAPAENGIRVVGGVGTSVTLARASDADIAAELPVGTQVTVTSGTVNGDTTWRLVAAASVTLDTTALYWTRLYPAYQQVLRDPWLMTGHLQENFPRILAATPSVGLTSGTMRVTGGFVLRAGTTYTNIILVSGTTAGASMTNQWAALIRVSDRAFLRSSADQTSGAWAANTAKVFVLSSTYTPAVDTPVYVGIMVAGTTPPSLSGVQNLTGTTNNAPVWGGTSNTGATTPIADATIATALTANVAVAYAALS